MTNRQIRKNYYLLWRDLRKCRVSFLPGLVFVDLDDEWIVLLQTELARYGYVEPPFFYAGGVGAHITIVPAKVSIVWLDWLDHNIE